MSENRKKFWVKKALEDMTPHEWESLCDRCGVCCLNKLVGEGRFIYTNVACSLLDLDSCLCKDYEDRSSRVTGCLDLTAENISAVNWLPSSCAYRLLFRGEDLKPWHPLVSGGPVSVRSVGISAHGKIVGEEFIHPHQLIEHVIYWVSTDYLPLTPT